VIVATTFSVVDSDYFLLFVEECDMAEPSVSSKVSTHSSNQSKRENRKKEEYEKNGSNNHKQIVEKQGPFDAWLENKTRQRAQQKEVEKLRAQIITSELLSVDYSESELAYERWLKQKNQSKRAESREKDKKRQEDKEEMKTVLNNIKTRWRIDYNKSRYLHPNNIRGWDDTPVYSNGPPVLPW